MNSDKTERDAKLDFDKNDMLKMFCKKFSENSVKVGFFTFEKSITYLSTLLERVRPKSYCILVSKTILSF